MSKCSHIPMCTSAFIIGELVGTLQNVPCLGVVMCSVTTLARWVLVGSGAALSSRAPCVAGSTRSTPTLTRALEARRLHPLHSLPLHQTRPDEVWAEGAARAVCSCCARASSTCSSNACSSSRVSTTRSLFIGTFTCEVDWCAAHSKPVPVQQC